MKSKITPWAMIVAGFFALYSFQDVFAGAFILTGIVMLIEYRWPEKRGNTK